MTFTIEKRFRELLGSESGLHAFREAGGFRICLIYPNTYHVGMSNLGLQVNLAALGDVPGITCERAFLPDPDLRGEFGPGRSRLVSLETRRPLDQFHVLAFTVTYELDYIHVVRMLRLAGIEPRRERRGPGSPLIIAGGAAVTANPFAMEDVFDLSWIGESEARIRSFAGALRDGWGTPGLLEDLAHHPHVFVPGRSDYRSVYTSIEQFELDEHPAHSHILTPATAFSSTALMEITRGCKWPCRFCIARTLYGPVRRLSPETVTGIADRLGRWTRKLGLFGAGISDYPDLSGLIRGLADRGFIVNASSLRIAAMTPELLQALDAAGQRTVTVAPESFSLRILKALAKGLNEVSLHRGLECIVASKLRAVKVYHIIGVPGETPEDLDCTVETLAPYARRARHLLWELGYSILEPKPHTPYEHLELASRAEVDASVRHVRKTMHRIGRVKVSYPSFPETWLCDWLCRGDHAVGRMLVDEFPDDPWGKFHLGHGRYRELMTEQRRRGFPWAILPEEPRLKDGRHIIAPRDPPATRTGVRLATDLRAPIPPVHEPRPVPALDVRRG